MAMGTQHGNMSFIYSEQGSQFIWAIVQKSRWSLPRENIGEAAKSLIMQEMVDMGFILQARKIIKQNSRY